MYIISQLYVIYVAVKLLFPLHMLMYYCLYYPEKGLIVLSRKRLICFAFNKNVKSNKVAAYCFNMVLQIHLFAKIIFFKLVENDSSRFSTLYLLASILKI